jgi:hypothetical protein
MTVRIFLKPAPDKVVRKPVGGHLLPEGEWVNQESYWLRRLNDGDVVEADAPAELAEAAAAPAAKSTGSKAR